MDNMYQFCSNVFFKEENDAAKKLQSKDELTAYLTEHPYAADLELIEKIDDEELLEKIAICHWRMRRKSHREDEPLRELDGWMPPHVSSGQNWTGKMLHIMNAALKKVSDQERLYRILIIALATGDVRLSESVLKYMDGDYLSNTGLNRSNLYFNKETALKIAALFAATQAEIGSAALTDENYMVRAAAVRLLEDQETLLQIVKSDTGHGWETERACFKEAVSRIKDWKALAEVFLYDSHDWKLDDCWQRCRAMISEESREEAISWLAGHLLHEDCVSVRARWLIRGLDQENELSICLHYGGEAYIKKQIEIMETCKRPEPFYDSMRFLRYAYTHFDKARELIRSCDGRSYQKEGCFFDDCGGGHIHYYDVEEIFSL